MKTSPQRDGKVDMMLTAHKTAAIFMRYVYTEDGPTIRGMVWVTILV